MTDDNVSQKINLSNGISLRDWFAGQAMCGLLASGVAGVTCDGFAMRSYKVADAMLEERKVKDPT